MDSFEKKKEMLQQKKEEIQEKMHEKNKMILGFYKIITYSVES